MPNSRNDNEDLADLVRRLRSEKGFSQQKVADNSDGEISKGYVGQIENRHVLGRSVTPQKLSALAKGLDTSEDIIFAAARGISVQSDSEFDKSEFALMYSEVEKLTPQQQHDFKIAWEMAKGALKRIKEGGRK